MDVSSAPVVFPIDSNTWSSSCTNNCNNHGTCLNGTCYCFKEFSGVDCSTRTCYNSCWNHGKCVDGNCQCDDFFNTRINVNSSTYYRDYAVILYDPASACEDPVCPYNCSSNGKCTSSGCVCYPMYQGPICGETSCWNLNSCRQRGTCSNGVCTCPSYLLSPDCASQKIRQLITPNQGCNNTAPFLCNGQCGLSAGGCIDDVSIPTDSVKIAAYPYSTITVSSNSPSKMKIVDGDESTFWQSDFCYNSFQSRPDLNILFNLTQKQDTDGKIDTSISVPLTNQKATYILNIPSSSVFKMGYKVVITGTLSFTFALSNGTSMTITASDADNYKWMTVLFPESYMVDSLTLSSSSAFVIYEIALQGNECSEWALIDFGSIVEIGHVSGRHMSGANASLLISTKYEVSNDTINWISPFPPVYHYTVGSVDMEPSSSYSISCQYLRVTHTLPRDFSSKVYIWEIQSWGRNGRYGPYKTATPNSNTIRNIFGVNGIWGWGTSAFSNSSKASPGIGIYKKVLGHARNYHNWNWDSKDPDLVPQYTKMATPQKGLDGLLAQNWLNWHWEYNAWSDITEVQVAFQFTPSMFPASVFNTPYDSSVQVGSAFANAFGPLKGAGNVLTFEVGNEPWGYPTSLYKSVLLGMAQGIKSVDPYMKVLPGAFPLSTFSSIVDYSNIKYIDGLNVHMYSFYGSNDGRKSTYPESRISQFRGINEWIRWNTNLGLPIYVSEFGWDGSNSNEPCTHSECVSELSQALYAVRGLLLLSRLGIQRATWYFYGDTNEGTGVFSKSGLTVASSQGGFPKLSFYTMKNLRAIMGDSYFYSVIQETNDAYVYVFAVDDVPSYVVAWRPISGDDNSNISLSVPIPWNPIAAYTIVSEIGTTSLPSVLNGIWNMDVSSAPVVFPIDSNTWSSSCTNNCNNHGTCLNGTCYCFKEFSGVDCSTRTCYNSCWNHGKCVDGNCQCDDFFNTRINVNSSTYYRDYAVILYDPASACEDPVCPYNCSSNGKCTSSGCVCYPMYQGPICGETSCWNLNSCRQRGTCSNGVCTCPSYLLSPDCASQKIRQLITPNQGCNNTAPFLCNGQCGLSAGGCIDDVSIPTDSVKIAAYPYSTITVSSNSPSKMKIVDGDESTFWQSDFCYNSFQSRPDLNILFNLTQKQDTDGKIDTSISVPLTNQKATYILNIPSSSVFKMGYKVVITGTLSFTFALSNGTSMTITASDADNYKWMTVLFPESYMVDSLTLSSSSAFVIYEIALQGNECSEWALIDFGSIVEIGHVSGRHMSGANASLLISTKYEVSNDTINWISPFPPVYHYTVGSVDMEPSSSYSISCQYLRVTHTLPRDFSSKVYIWEIQSWGRNGRYGPYKTATPNSNTIRNIFGVNGIWGWGTSAFSNSSKASPGIGIYKKVLGHARNYHNWNWDSKDPDLVPQYTKMATPQKGLDGLLAQNWLNWHWEYNAWSDITEVQVAFQFTPSMFPASVFNTPYDSSVQVGSAFANAFGPLKGAGNVLTFEVGNEPWGYPTFYANTDTGSGVFSKSGLTTSSKTGFTRKAVLDALEITINLLGNTRFIDVLQEDNEAYIYRFGAGTVPQYIVAWIPTHGDSSMTKTVQLDLGQYMIASATALFPGYSVTQPTQGDSTGNWTIQLTPTPVAYELNNPSNILPSQQTRLLPLTPLLLTFIISILFK
eukprot:TRINITY_DN4671_c0_g1_i1.p1 TRINITY_DN4671_c0_g1~~TRINITY_DN4671_c0_g1_i1.p1  ORF type:complete len:1802 (+),score=396.26 TRINITY_DN4671_c0_g1_i1:379-5406(+)